MQVINFPVGRLVSLQNPPVKATSHATSKHHEMYGRRWQMDQAAEDCLKHDITAPLDRLFWTYSYWLATADMWLQGFGRMKGKWKKRPEQQYVNNMKIQMWHCISSSARWFVEGLGCRMGLGPCKSGVGELQHPGECHATSARGLQFCHVKRSATRREGRKRVRTNLKGGQQPLFSKHRRGRHTTGQAQTYSTIFTMWCRHYHDKRCWHYHDNPVCRWP
jgi:hypothetical protein